LVCALFAQHQAHADRVLKLALYLARPGAGDRDDLAQIERTVGVCEQKPEDVPPAAAEKRRAQVLFPACRQRVGLS
jgi:hypothetical protein